MSTHKTLVQKYINDFSQGEYEQALSYLTEDVVFDFVGQAEIHGKAELETTIKTFTAISGGSTYTIDRLIEEGDSVVVVGSGVGVVTGVQREFLFCDVFTFEGDAISRVETYQVQLRGPELETVWSNARSGSEDPA